jgi:hypothetical protein
MDASITHMLDSMRAKTEVVQSTTKTPQQLSFNAAKIVQEVRDAD